MTTSDIVLRRNYYEKVIQDIHEKKLAAEKHREECEVVGCVICQMAQMEILSIEHALNTLRYYQP